MAHCAWMASCASGTLPQSMPTATTADERVQQPCPTSGITSEPPSAASAQYNKNDDPYCVAYKELHHKLLFLIEDYPGVWASYDSGERQELLRPTLRFQGCACPHMDCRRAVRGQERSTIPLRPMMQIGHV
eukprot:1341452-Pyramimonas_sp.AAC.1